RGLESGGSGGHRLAAWLDHALKGAATAPSPPGRVPSLSPSSRLTMSRSFTYRTGAAVVLAGITTACGGRIRPVPSAEPAAAAASTVDRMTVRTGEQQVVVDSPVAIGRQVERLVQEAGGYIERSSGDRKSTRLNSSHE